MKTIRINRHTTAFLFVLFLLSCATHVWGKEADFLKLSKTYTLHTDGSTEVRVEKALVLHTHLAFNSLYGETFIEYNPGYQEVEFHSAYTIQADGTRVDVPENAFNEVLPSAAADAPAYNHLKEIVVTHTGLEIGATIYLDYSLHTKAGYYPALDIDEIVEEDSPVKAYTLTVDVPESKPFAYHLNASNLKPSVQKENGRIRYRWNFKNIPASPKLPFLPLNRTDAIRLTASTALSAENALTGWAANWNGTLDEEWKTFVQSLTGACKTPQEKADVLQKYVSSKIGYSRVSPEMCGYTLRTPGEVLRSAYGTEAEKTNLLAVLFREAGLEPEIAAVYPAGMAYGLMPVRSLAVMNDNRFYSASRQSAGIESRGELDEVWIFDTHKAYRKPVSAEVKENIVLLETKGDDWKQIPENNGYAILEGKQKSDVHFWQMDRLNSNRNVVLEIPNLIRADYTHTVTLPEGSELQTLPTEIDLDNPAGHVRISISREGNTVTVKRMLELKKQHIQPSGYKDFRTIILTWLDKNTEQLLVRLDSK